MELGNFQFEAATKLKNYSKKLKERGISSGKSAYTFIATWGDNLGFEHLKYRVLRISNFKNFFVIFLKDLFFTFTTHSYQILSKSKIGDQKKIIFSNATLKDFKVDGSYIDRYFKINSNNYKDFFFILIYSDIELPKKIDKNLVLICRKKNSILKGLLIFFSKLMRFKIKKNFFHSFSASTSISEKTLLITNKLIDFKKIDKIILPYEGIPFQQELFLEAKKINPKIKTIGYDHSAPHAVPFHLLYRDGSPDLLMINGESQKKYLVKYLDWNENKIKLVPSLRYNKYSEENFDSLVFFPWKIINEKKILLNLESFLKNSEPNSINFLKVKTHPVSVDEKKQLLLKKQIENLFNIYKDKFGADNKKTSIFIGSTTGIIVALEKDINVIHICFDPLFEAYSEKMWPQIKVTNIYDNTFVYNLKKKNSFIQFGEGGSSFSDYYDI